MTDYSKPIGWWCREHNCEYDVFTTCNMIDCTNIPVYPVIPEGERPQTIFEREDVFTADVLGMCTFLGCEADHVAGFIPFGGMLP